MLPLVSLCFDKSDKFPSNYRRIKPLQCLLLLLSTQVYKWVPGKFNGGGSPAMD